MAPPARHRAPTCRRALGTPEGGRGGTAQPADDALSAAGGPRCLRLPGAGAGAPPDALVAAAHTACIPYGFDLAAFAAAGGRSGQSDGARVVHVGRLTPSKGAEDMLDVSPA